MWLKRGHVSSNSFLRLFARPWPHYFGKPLNAADRGIYFTRNPFRTGFLSMGNNFEILSRRFSCSRMDSKRKGLVSAEDEDESENTLGAEENDAFEFDEIDNLAQFLDDNIRNKHIISSDVIIEEHLKYLTELADGNDETLRDLKLCYRVIKRSTDTLGIDFRFQFYSWLDMTGHSFGRLHRVLKNQLMREIQRLSNERNKHVFPRLYRFRVVNEFDINCYHLFHNALFLRFQKSVLNYSAMSKGIVSMLYSPHLVFDCSYEQYMTTEEISFLARQLSFVIADNFKSKMPLHIVLCNFNDSLYLSKIIHKHIPKFHMNTLPITVTEKSYLDLYPRKDLCYLSPNGNETGGNWNPNKVYIVGAFVDKMSENQKISLAKAKMDNIDHIRFPLEKYLNWKCGSKRLSLPHVCKIMCDMYYYKDWKKAFESLPGRFTRGAGTNEKSPGRKHKSYVKQVISDSYQNTVSNVPRTRSE